MVLPLLAFGFTDVAAAGATATAWGAPLSIDSSAAAASPRAAFLSCLVIHFSEVFLLGHICLLLEA